MKRQLTLGQKLTLLILCVIIVQAAVILVLFFKVFNPGMQEKAFDVVRRGALASTEVYVNKWSYDIQIASASRDDRASLQAQMRQMISERSSIVGISIFMLKEDAVEKPLNQLNHKKDFIALYPMQEKDMSDADKKVYARFSELFTKVSPATMVKVNKDGSTTGSISLKMEDLVLAGTPVLVEGRLIGYLVYAESIKEYLDYQATFSLSLITAFIISIILVAIFVFFVGAAAARPITRVSQTAARIADGDLTDFGKLETGLAETYVLSKAIQEMGRAFQEQVATVKTLTATASSVSREVVRAMSHLSASAAEQAAAVAETASTVEEMEKTGKSVANAATRIVEAADKSAEGSVRGRQAVDTASGIIIKIKEDSQNISQKSKMLLSNVEEIGNIINSVNAIAEQSKILAVNASIEAAKAGEYGAGFAVVAQEVKDLAGQSKEATEQITRTLTSIRHAIESMVDTAESGESRTGEGVSAVSNAGAIVNDLSEAIQEASSVANVISTSVNQQSLGLSQIASAIEEINVSASENQSISRKIEESTRGMAEAISELQMLVDIWKTEADAPASGSGSEDKHST